MDLQIADSRAVVSLTSHCRCSQRWPRSSAAAPELNARVERLASRLRAVTGADPTDHDLRRLVRNFALLQRSRGERVERVVIALKEEVAASGGCPGRLLTERDALLDLVVTWCIRDYFSSGDVPGAD